MPAGPILGQQREDVTAVVAVQVRVRRPNAGATFRSGFPGRRRRRSTCVSPPGPATVSMSDSARFLVAVHLGRGGEALLELVEDEELNGREHAVGGLVEVVGSHGTTVRSERTWPRTSRSCVTTSAPSKKWLRVRTFGQPPKRGGSTVSLKTPYSASGPPMFRTLTGSIWRPSIALMPMALYLRASILGADGGDRRRLALEVVAIDRQLGADVDLHAQELAGERNLGSGGIDPLIELTTLTNHGRQRQGRQAFVDRPRDRLAFGQGEAEVGLHPAGDAEAARRALGAEVRIRADASPASCCSGRWCWCRSRRPWREIPTCW